MNNNKLFYFMHIPWGWAKQRPQLLAEALAKHIDLLVCYKQPLTKNNQVQELTSIKRKPLLLLPYQAKLSIIRKINIILTRFLIRKQIATAQYVWLTSPELFPYLPSLTKNQILIYDCMDDMIEFPNIKHNKKLLKYYKQAEAKLVEKADYVFCSSDNLRLKLQQRYNPAKHLSVINNGIAESFFNRKSASKIQILKNYSRDKTNIFYIGTVAKWMDWELIRASLKRDNNLAYHFIGPCEISIPETEGITLHGAYPHNQLNNVINLADVLVMPFIVDGLIESVNPVKLYEYVCTGKPSIAVRYKESELFKEFVHLYNGIDEYMQLLKEIKNAGIQHKADKNKALDFCRRNTWNNRAQTVMDSLLTLSE